MILAEVSVDMVAGGTVTGMLTVVMVAMLRRTKDTDERKDEFSRMVLETAAQHEAAAYAERDEARSEAARLRDELQKERDKWNTPLPQRNPTRPNQDP